jgi:phosphoribosylaminoimidazole carboxylase (EC 4.1.1.21)
VEFLFAPAKIKPEIETKASEIAVQIISNLEMVGILAVEFFLTKTGDLLVNEIAPRPHNSGHHTIEANYTSQFEQHLRAICNLPLGNTDIILPAVMLNILGSENHNGPTRYQGIKEVLNTKGVFAHIYGKAKTSPNRKMAHITIVDNELDVAIEKAKEIKQHFAIISE